MMAGGVITVIGGGWSVRNIPLARVAGAVIAVNDAAILAPNWDYAVSMDRLWTENRFDQLERIVTAAGRLKTPVREVWIRRNALQNLPSTAGLPWLYPFECDHTTSNFTAAPDQLNGTNSGACALNLAYQLQPRRVYLLGFDMNRDKHGRAYWYPPYPWSSSTGSTTAGKYGTWAGQFAAAADAFKRIGTEVFNVSPSSAIDNFPKITPAEYLKECP